MTGTFSGISMAIPSDLFAGDTVKFTVTVPNYPASTWTLKFALRGASALTVNAAATGSTGTDFGVTLSATQTATLTPGFYEWVTQVTSGSEAYTADSGRITIKPNVMTATAGSRQSTLETNLAAIEAVLASRITADVVAHTIGNRSVTKIPMHELLTMRAMFARELWHLVKGSGRFGKGVPVYFARPE